MNYTSFSLNGAWEMKYQYEKYTEKECPFKDSSEGIDAAGTEPEAISNNIIKDAVPGYWEDMKEKFSVTSFFCRLRINPEYGLQSYPIAGDAPDMALPNIIGNFFYKRSFVCENITSPAKIHFEGVQNSVSVWINGAYLARHEGYSTPFDIDIPEGLLNDGKNEIVLSVSNHRLEGFLDEPVSGLTSRAANECTGGITGDVELRVYKSPLRDVAVLISEDLKTAEVRVEAASPVSFRWEVFDEAVLLKEGTAESNFTFCTDGMSFWSPECPKLYTLKISSEKGDITRRFGIRRLTADGVKFNLNGSKYYLRGICEHCYFPETIHPNHDYLYYRSIIKAIKELGFNFVRFHTYIPEEEYMQAADELGILLHVECPNNTLSSEWKEIVKFCRRHTSVVIYCCGNELLIDEPFIEYLNECADSIHENTDALFSPMNALRGLEYFWVEPGIDDVTSDKPLKHHPGRFKKLGEFSDMYSSYILGHHSYFSTDCNVQEVDSYSSVYNKPRVSHEICIDGTYTDLSLKSRYKNLRVGQTDMFDSIERHLEKKGLLEKAPLYFKNSSEWQRRVRKYCFEQTRRCKNVAGYDFLGPIDTHWHTFGYDVGMMNEFYELKPGETVRNVLMYNSPTVLLNDLGRKTNFVSGESLNVNLLASHYGECDLVNAHLNIRLVIDGKIAARENVMVEKIENGSVNEIYAFNYTFPETQNPAAVKLYVTLDCENIFVENEWELYLFPKASYTENEDVVVSSGLEENELIRLLEEGKDVLILGTKPFKAKSTSFRIALSGRTSGNLATVVKDHPIFEKMPHSGFCGWQFAELLEGGKAVCFEAENVPFDPIVEVVSTHKFAIKQAALFEFKALNGRLLVSSFDFKESDPAAKWLKSQILSYMQSDLFCPGNEISKEGIHNLVNSSVTVTAANSNLAFNPNDKTAVRKNKK